MQIAVYAGGIVVLFVFAILLTSHPGHSSERLASKRRVIGLIASLAMLAVAGYSLFSRINLFNAAPQLTPEQAVDMDKIGTAILGTGDGQYLLPFEAISVLLLACIIGGIVVARKR